MKEGITMNNSDVWENLRFSFYTMKNLKVIYKNGDGKIKQDLHTALLELVAKKNEFESNDSRLNQLINDTVNKYFEANGADAVKAYWKAFMELLNVDFKNENSTLMYVLNSAHPLRKVAGDKALLETYSLSFIDYRYSGAMIILTKDSPDKMIKKTVSPLKQAQQKMLKQVNELHKERFLHVQKEIDEMTKCKFCNDGEGIKYGDFETLYVDEKNKTLTYEIEDWDGSCSETPFPIEFCPKCGRKLK